MASDLHTYSSSELLNKVLSDDETKLKCDNTVTQLSNVTVNDTGVIATMQDDIASIKTAVEAIKLVTDKLTFQDGSSTETAVEVKTY